ncbi:lipopolysaccharide biosynthesis protein [Pseudarthrobacter quantipunctorum]|uniref:Polysaccharide biosynthesis protein C-terminal domain-containing protein n=1 Tax=Pseudarthrobacter quantipunctorum TaxID=3128980 RepID=A0ABZ2RE75_9MICC
MAPDFSVLRRLTTFAATVGASTLVGILAIPIIIRVAGTEAWAVQVVCQSVASLFAVVIGFGWGTTGPSMVASTPRQGRFQLFADSLVSRTYLFIIGAPAMATLMIVLQPNYVALVVLGTVAYLLPSVGAAWYFIGESNPKRLFFLDASPQLLGTIVGIVGLYWTGQIEALVFCQMVFTLLGVILSASVVLRGGKGLFHCDLGLKASFSRLSHQRHGVITAATGSLYVNLPLVAVSAWLPLQLDLYAMIDRIFRYSVTAFSPVLQFVQGWVPEGGDESLRHRIKRAIQAGAMLGALGSAAIFLLSPVISSLLSDGKLVVPTSLSLPVALSFFSVALSQILGLACLVLIGRGAALAKSTVLGAVAGAPLILITALNTNVTGVAWAVAASELVVTIYQLVVIRRFFRGLPQR